MHFKSPQFANLMDNQVVVSLLICSLDSSPFFLVGNSVESHLFLIYKFKKISEVWEQNGYKNTRTYAEGVEKSQTIQCFSAWGLLCRITTWDICACIKLSQRKASGQTITQTSSSAQSHGNSLFRSTCQHI